MSVRNGQPEDLAATTHKVIYVTAVLATGLGALYLVGLAARLIVNGSVHAPSSQDVQSLSAIVAILWNLGLLVLFAALRREVSGERALFAELALIFMALVCATSSVSWFVQLAVVPKLAAGADAGALALLDMQHELSITYAMEHLGWGLFFGLSALFAAAANRGGRLEIWVRWLLGTSGALSLLHFAGVILGNAALGDLGYVAWGLLLPVSTALLAVRFRQERQPRTSAILAGN